MRNLFIRALWGDDLMERRPKVLEDIQRSLDGPHQLPSENYVVMAYGRNNLETLAAIGVEATLVHQDAIVDWDGVGVRNPQGRGGHNYGWSLWRHKTDAMERAFRDFDAGAIVWLDWDCNLQQPLPADFWARLGERKPVQITLVSYHRRHCVWRKPYGGRSVPEGAFIYLRHRGILDRVHKIYAKNKLWVDQTAFAWVIDEMSGGWNGLEGELDWRDNGWEPYCHRIGNQFHEPEEIIFATLRGDSHGRWVRKHKRREAQA